MFSKNTCYTKNSDNSMKETLKRLPKTKIKII